MLLTGCNKEKYYIPKSVLDVLDIDATQYSEDIKDVYYYDGTYEEVYSEEGNLVFVADEEQVKGLLQIGIEGIEYYKFVMNKKDMYFEYNDTYTELVVKCSKEQFELSLTEKGMKIFVACVAWNQALTGVKPEDLYVYGVVKDIETDEIIYEYELYGR